MPVRAFFCVRTYCYVVDEDQLMIVKLTYLQVVFTQPK